METVILTKNEKNLIKEAQQYCTSLLREGTKINCPFPTPDNIDWKEVQIRCRLCHKWMSTLPKFQICTIMDKEHQKVITNHPCNCLNKEDIIRRFWRKV